VAVTSRCIPLVVAAVAVFLLVGCAVWLGVAALRAHSALSAARGHLEQGKTALLAGDGATATAELGQAATDTAAGRSATDSVAWNIAAAVPVAGRPFVTVRDLAQAADDLVVQVLQPVAQAGVPLSPAELRPSGDRIDVARLVSARPALATASAAAAALDERASRIPATGFVPPIDDARRTAQGQVSELAAMLGTANSAATLLPPMLGSDGPRTYLLAFQTNAEARGTGGMLGAFGMVTADDGEIAVDTLATNRDLEQGATPGIDLGPDYREQYAGYNSTTLWNNANSSPHFPYAAQIWSSLWSKQGGQKIEGVIAFDPVALSYILEATGPMNLRSGETIDAANVVRITESEAYDRFRDDNAARKDYLESIATATATKVLSGGSTSEILSALGRAAGERRLAVWSAVPGEQEVLANTVLGHVVPETNGPYAAVVVLNGGGGKLDYYLHRSLSYVAGGCSAAHRQSLVSVDLRNGAPSGPLPDYVVGERLPSSPPNTNQLLVSLYATNGAELRGVSVDGTPTTARIGAERGHPVFTTTLLIPPGATQRLVFDLVEPTSPGEAVVPVQPLVEPMSVTTNVPYCQK
jgi:hypothetical protein